MYRITLIKITHSISGKPHFTSGHYGQYFALVCLARHLSERFSCSALAVDVYDGSIFWYHLCQNGELLDEYTTHEDDNWQPGKVLDYFPINPQIKGGNAKKLCTAFDKEIAIEQVEAILRKPTYIPNNLIEDSAVYALNLPRFLELLRIKSYSSINTARIRLLCLTIISVKTRHGASLHCGNCDNKP